jgi:hypothetical protein
MVFKNFSWEELLSYNKDLAFFGSGAEFQNAIEHHGFIIRKMICIIDNDINKQGKIKKCGGVLRYL